MLLNGRYNKINGNAYAVLLIFTAVYYLVPFIFQFTYPGKFEFYFNVNNNFYYYLIIPFTIFLVWIFDLYFPRIKTEKNILVLIGKFVTSEILNLIFSIIFLAFALYFFSKYSFDFRHKVRFQDAGTLIVLVFAIGSYFKTMIFGLVLMLINGYEITKRQRLINFIVLISLVLTATSSYDVLYILIIFSFTVGIEKYIFLNRKSSGIFDFFKANLKYILLGGFGFVTLFMGVANKYGIEESVELLKNGDFFFLVIRRISMWYVSIQIAGESFFNDISMPIDPFFGLIKDTFRRVSILLGGNPVKPEIWGINRMNHLLVYPVATVHAGSSPGIYASVFYLPFFPASIIFIALYIMFILRNLADVLTPSSHQISLVGYFLMILFIGVFFESPIEQINFVGKAFIYFIFNLTWIFYIKYRNSKFAE